MAKEEGVKTVVYGGRKGVQQHYCGTVGGQSTDFSTIDTEIKVRPMSPKYRFEKFVHVYPVKTTQLKNDPLAPFDL